MKNNFYFALLLLALVGCQSNTTQEAEEPSPAQRLFDESMAVHDEVMPRMEEIMQLRQKLQLRVKSLQEEDSAEFADSLQRIQSAIQHLQEADEAMMQWMRSVQKVPGEGDDQPGEPDEVNDPSTTSPELVQVQQEQKEAIMDIKQQMEASITEAQQMIGLPE